MLQLAELLKASAGSTAAIQLAPGRVGEQQRSSVDIDKAARELGWRPRMGIEDGLRATFRYFAERFTPEGR